MIDRLGARLRGRVLFCCFWIWGDFGGYAVFGEIMPRFTKL